MSAIVRLFFLYIHVVAFAIALGCVLREDAKLISSRPLDLLALQAASRIVASALAVLWASGFAIIILDNGGDFLAIGSNAKLLAKLVIVCALTINGLGLHLVAFPRLRNPSADAASAARVAAALGAISATSWAFATLLGISKDLPRLLTFGGLILIYCLTLACGICAATILVAPILRRKLLEREGGAYVVAESRRMRMG